MSVCAVAAVDDVLVVVAAAETSIDAVVSVVIGVAGTVVVDAIKAVVVVDVSVHANVDAVETDEFDMVEDEAVDTLGAAECAVTADMTE